MPRGSLERVAMHGQARMTGVRKTASQSASLVCSDNGNDVGAGNHDIADMHFMQGEDVFNNARSCEETSSSVEYRRAFLDVVADRSPADAKTMRATGRIGLACLQKQLCRHRHRSRPRHRVHSLAAAISSVNVAP